MPSLNLEAFIRKHLSYQDQIKYEPEELLGLLDLARATYCRVDSRALIDVPIPVNIVGDIHGQFTDLLRIFSAVGVPGRERYLFLGDYVDRGPAQTECIALLLSLKICIPTKVYLLRGNHECQSVNLNYGFQEELQRRFSVGLATKLFNELNEVFGYMPLAALVRKRILCMHGGLSPKLNRMDDLERIRMPVTDPLNGSLEHDILWSDPSMGQHGFGPNVLRDCSVVFGEDIVNKTCKNLGLDLVVRAHQMMPNGYGFFANRKLVTVFSAPRYVPEINNKGGIIKIDRNMTISYIIINPVLKKEATGPAGFQSTFSRDSSLSNVSNAAMKQ